jgi:hypothetical protein
METPFAVPPLPEKLPRSPAARRLVPRLVAALILVAFSVNSRAARPVGEPQLERPTLHSLGVYWVVRDDPGRTASVQVEYRKAGAPAWRAGFPLFRVERGAHVREKIGSRIDVPADGWLFAGSVLLLEPATAYELRLTLVESQGGKTAKRTAAGVSRVLRAQTRAEPRVPAGGRMRHVIPGSGGGRGTEADPYRGLAAAHSASAPGELFLIHKGTYAGPWVVNRSGTAAKPIVWAAAGDGPAVIDGQGSSTELPAHAIEASGTHDVWFLGLTVQNAHHGVTFHDSARIVVRDCHIQRVEYGMNAVRDTRAVAQDHFVSDNLIEGPSTWPRSKGIENARGIQITGEGHVLCYNRIRGFADAIDTLSSARCAAIDIHNNDLSELTDDGIELDFSERNNRCFLNRLTNVFQGISMQPVHGGPVYVFRNVIYNVAAEPFKLHNSPSGCLIFHNTIVKQGPPSVLMTPEPVRNSWTRNNLFLGTEANYAFETNAKMVDCDFDYDGFGGGPFKLFLKWNGVRYGTLDEARRKAPVFKHAVLVDAATAFGSGARPPEDVARAVANAIDLRLSPRSRAVDAGQPLTGFNDGYHGKAPDLGAYELGDPLPHYGPREPGRSDGR